MGTKHRSIWRAASMAIAALAMMSTLSSCIVTRPWQGDRWHRDSRTNHERRHDDHRDRRAGDSESRSEASR